jgi:serine/threonine-protein kinase RsbW
VNSSATNRVSYTLDSTLESVNRAESKALEMAARGGFNEDSQQNIAMAVREAAVNAVLHGNAYDPQKKFVVAYEITPQALVITITDQGRGLDPENIPDPLSPDNLMKNSGRGIFLIRAFMDEVTIRNLNPGTEITLVKNVGREAANAKEDTQ